MQEVDHLVAVLLLSKVDGQERLREDEHHEIAQRAEYINMKLLLAGKSSNKMATLL